MIRVQSQSEGLRTGAAADVNRSSKAGEDELSCPSSNSEAQKKGEGKFLLLPAFVLFRPWISLDDVQLHWGGQFNLLSLPSQSI